MAGLLALAAALLLQPAIAEIRAEADVAISDGAPFVMETRYRSPIDASYVSRRPREETILTVDAAGVWREERGERRPQAADLALWILSHQFHAQLLDFDTIGGGADLRPAPPGSCDCIDRVGRRAAPGLGIEGLVLRADRASGQAREVLVLRAGKAPIRITFADWRPVAGRTLPFRVDLEDEARSFVFRFRRVEIAER
ncbi:MAG TPA: hypothetical protein VMG08_17570 [Allosphingosinicella sp.]|nr:hypothetical protein [Allosphingosinicella sp.]